MGFFSDLFGANQEFKSLHEAYSYEQDLREVREREAQEKMERHVNMIVETNEKREKEYQKEMLACDLLTGHGGLTVAQARAIAGMGMVNPEMREIKERLNRSVEEMRWDRIFLRMNLEKIKETKERLNSPKSIWIRKRAIRKLF